MSFESKEHYWIIVLEPCEGNPHFSSDTRLYWGSKKGRAAWTDDLVQATHFKTWGGARPIIFYRSFLFPQLYLHYLEEKG